MPGLAAAWSKARPTVQRLIMGPVYLGITGKFTSAIVAIVAHSSGATIVA